LVIKHKCQIRFCESPDDGGTYVPQHVGIDELLHFNVF
jgi:hypothetical protein